MKAYLVKKTFTDGEFEGVLFSSRKDAMDAFSGECETGSTLAVDWCEIYGEFDDVTIQEIDI